MGLLQPGQRRGGRRASPRAPSSAAGAGVSAAWRPRSLVARAGALGTEQEFPHRSPAEQETVRRCRLGEAKDASDRWSNPSLA